MTVLPWLLASLVGILAGLLAVAGVVTVAVFFGFQAERGTKRHRGAQRGIEAERELPFESLSVAGWGWHRLVDGGS